MTTPSWTPGCSETGGHSTPLAARLDSRSTWASSLPTTSSCRESRDNTENEAGLLMQQALGSQPWAQSQAGEDPPPHCSRSQSFTQAWASFSAPGELQRGPRGPHEARLSAREAGSTLLLPPGLQDKGREPPARGPLFTRSDWVSGDEVSDRKEGVASRGCTLTAHRSTQAQPSSPCPRRARPLGRRMGRGEAGLGLWERDPAWHTSGLSRPQPCPGLRPDGRAGILSCPSHPLGPSTAPPRAQGRQFRSHVEPGIPAPRAPGSGPGHSRPGASGDRCEGPGGGGGTTRGHAELRPRLCQSRGRRAAGDWPRGAAGQGCRAGMRSAGLGAGPRACP